MKKILNLIACVISSFVLCVFVSCTDDYKQETVSFGYNIPEEEKAENELFASIDSLNSKYVSNLQSSRGILRKWTRRGLSYMVDGCASAIAAGPTGGLGAAVFGILASGIYDDYMNWAENEMRKSPKKAVLSTDGILKTVIFTEVNADFVDSIGYYHNKILNEIKSSGVSYVKNDGGIDYDAMYSDIVSSLEKNRYRYDGTADKKKAMFAFINNLVKNATDPSTFDLDRTISFLTCRSCLPLKLQKEGIEKLKEICNRVCVTIAQLDTEDAVLYGKELNRIIEESTAALNIKQTLKVANNVSVNSNLYWSDK